MLFINEGFVLDDAGHMLMTSYVDLREEGERTAIRSLVKGCRREHALEDGETLLISKPERFREYDVALIRDEQEGFAREEAVTLEPETPEEAAERRANSDLNDALQLVGGRSKVELRIERDKRDTQNRYFSYGADWWIFCASIRPNDEEWDAWRATLDANYDHVSEIGQPAKFAQALARMVAEQIGPRGKKDDAYLNGTRNGATAVRTQHKSQLVFHGPVVYADSPYETIAGEENEDMRMALMLFVKPITHAAQREYRFVVMNGGAAEETVLLRIPGMMRDALPPKEPGLVRPTPTPAPEEPAGKAGTPPPCPVKGFEKLERTTVKERKVAWEETRVETRDPEGQVLSSDIQRRESVEERDSTTDPEPDGRGIGNLLRAEKREEAVRQNTGLAAGQGSTEVGDRDDEDAVAKELALKERGWRGEEGRDEFLVHGGSGRAYGSLADALGNPATPMNPVAKTWEGSACSPEEIAKSYGAIETLALKIARVPAERRHEAASACWHALQCVNNTYARLGDIVDSLWIERDRFVVIRIKDSEQLKATGRIAIGPTGAFAYCFQTSKREQFGWGIGLLGKLFFPLSEDVETFESFGWPGKAGQEPDPDKENEER